MHDPLCPILLVFCLYRPSSSFSTCLSSCLLDIGGHPHTCRFSETRRIAMHHIFIGPPPALWHLCLEVSAYLCAGGRLGVLWELKILELCMGIAARPLIPFF